MIGPNLHKLMWTKLALVVSLTASPKRNMRLGQVLKIRLLSLPRPAMKGMMLISSIGYMWLVSVKPTCTYVQECFLSTQSFSYYPPLRQVLECLRKSCSTKHILRTLDATIRRMLYSKKSMFRKQGVPYP